ncbi:ATP-dependent helicase [Halobaculum sp. CBA1158]|uniref:UvrD-helicase domain-containing protein n=1 Tax=Halobaculum sp. CBA1158 TaxID=2904243 RepID=UPI001F365A9E|nr:ATP-dependent helicase [Halobaculum sp. CBA1158]UIO99779.1 ATP-dependent helicase [Halobaculum sp. CBA1158]
MSEPTPNEDQRHLIESTEGIYRVDAGAGTGKTFAVTRRYARILETTDATPEDVLLVTFTRTAAREMRDRIGRRTTYDVRELQDAPISTFHAYCFRLLRRYGHTVPEALGIDEEIPDSVDLLEDSVRERRLFSRFVSRFADDHPEHAELLRIFRDPATLHELVGELAAKGVVPTRAGWYRGTDDPLTGDREAFFEAFAAANEPGEGARGPTNSDARSAVADWDASEYAPDAPPASAVHDGTRVSREVVERAYDADRDALLTFVRDVYVEYLEYALSQNTLTQGLMLALAFVMLCDRPTVRDRVAHEYVMVDEFQDTNELQFKIALLLSDTNNVCVVGDWKQSIYGFQHTSVENITEFDDRLRRFASDLNADRTRINYPVDETETIPLYRNYRSSASILEFAEESLSIPATYGERVGDPLADERSLVATNHVDNARIEAYRASAEHELLLDRIQAIVGNEAYAVEVREDPRPDEDAPAAERAAAERERLGAPSYGDIAVFTRTRAFAREFLERAAEYGVPVAYEGGVELFDTPEAKLALAWLRIAESDDRRGWAVALERAGYGVDRAETLLDAGAYPDAMTRFRDELAELETLGGFLRRVFDRYGRTNAYADALVDHLTGLYENSTLPRGEAIQYVEANLAAGTTVEIDASPGEDAVTLRTVHGAKGLEYPIVILANLNDRAFPHYGRPPACPVVYDDDLGVRQTREYSEAGAYPHVYRNWRYSLLRSVRPSTYDEERRLLYVAMTRAKRHLLFTAGENPSRFMDGLSIDATEVDPEPERVDSERPTAEPFAVDVPDRSSVPRRLSVHDLMDDGVYDDREGGRGTEFGTELHDFAEAYADGAAAEPSNDDQRAVAAFLDGLDGDLRTEVPALLPLPGEPRVTLAGVIDLVHVTDGRVDVVDYKTDPDRLAHGEYRTQLSAYHHVLASVYPDRTIRLVVYYTAEDEAVAVDPIDLDALRALVPEK